MTKKTTTKKKVARKPKQSRSENKTAKVENEEKAKSKKNTSLRLDKHTLKALKILAIENETSIQSLIESLIKDYLKKKSPKK